MDQEVLFTLSHSMRTEGHSMTLKGDKFRTNTRKYFLTQFPVSQWNLLPQDIIETKSLAGFKKG